MYVIITMPDWGQCKKKDYITGTKRGGFTGILCAKYPRRIVASQLHNSARDTESLSWQTGMYLVITQIIAGIIWHRCHILPCINPALPTWPNTRWKLTTLVCFARFSRPPLFGVGSRYFAARKRVPRPIALDCGVKYAALTDEICELSANPARGMN